MGEAKNIYFTCLKFVKKRHWRLAEDQESVGEEAEAEQTDPPVDPDAHGEHDPIQRQEASLEENPAQALNAFFREVECARFQKPFSRGTSVLLFSHGDFSQLSWIKNSTITIWHQCNIRIVSF